MTTPHLLPSNAAPFEISQSLSTDALTKLGEVADSIARFKSVPGDPLLPFLIWEYGLGELQPYLVEPRRVIREGLIWQRLRGTPAAVIMALSWIGMSAVIEEEQGGTGDGSNGYWATYQLGLPQIADTETVQNVVHLARLSQPARCRLWRIYTDAFDRRPIVVGNGPKLGNGWLSFYSGVSVPEAPGSDDDVIVSFGTRNAYQAAQAYPDALCASFGSIIHLAFLAPYLDRFVVGRSRLSDVYPRNHGFFMGSLFSILWADRATTGRRWRGEWDARCWLDYTGFDRKLPPWRMEKRAISRAQLVPGWGETLGDCNARLGATFATVIDTPMRLGESRLSTHDSQRRELRLHEMFVDMQGYETPPVHPGIPQTAGASLLVVTALVPNPHRVRQARHDELSAHMQQRESLPPREAARLALAAQSVAVTPDPAPPSALTSFRAPLWLGAWSEPGRTWHTEKLLSVQ